jgi:hypothetical protein
MFEKIYAGLRGRLDVRVPDLPRPAGTIFALIEYSDVA